MPHFLRECFDCGSKRGYFESILKTALSVPEYRKEVLKVIKKSKVKIYYFLKDFFTSKNVFFVDEQFTFNNAINDIESEHLIAIDTEFVWRNTYFPKLSLIQISTGKKIYIFDCFSLNVSQLNKVLSDKNIIKIFHSSRVRSFCHKKIV